MRLLLLILLLGVVACDITRLRIVRVPPASVTVPHVVTCGDIAALAGTVVDGRRAGQSRLEQRRLVEPGGIAAPFHLGLVESVYDWPRPIFPSGWSRLRAETVAAASAHCLNPQGATLHGRR